MSDAVGSAAIPDRARSIRTASSDDATASGKPAETEASSATVDEPARTPASAARQQASRALAAGFARLAQASALSSSSDPAPSLTRGLGDRTLREGAQGDDVKALQQTLNDDGAHLDLDGNFGAATQAALAAYQKQNGIDADGVCGPQTRASLASSPATTPTPPAETGANLPPGTYDASKVTARELAKMNPLLRATVQRAQKALAQTIKAGGRVLVGTSEGNGGKPVVTVIPPGFDPSKPATVHTHYHGYYATVTPPLGHDSGTSERVQAIQKQNPQEIFVLPECANARDGSYATDWSNVKSQAQTTNDALRAAGIDDVDQRIVSAHSGGGAALQYAMQSKSDGSGVQADKLELQDCFYGQESAIASWARTSAGQRVQQVQYFHFENKHSDAGVKRAFGDRYHRYEAKSHNATVFQWMDAVAALSVT